MLTDEESGFFRDYFINDQRDNSVYAPGAETEEEAWRARGRQVDPMFTNSPFYIR
jgi:hypothetical protein